ncbi:hypothetical protein GEO21_10845 [Sphingobacterium faecium]|uniref:hypothetical protein n=1 Tax=Sphingobacterium faecium TaxID=34087 RepID=UPI001290BE23|nr:hypothetical protein [Sphingobacterium faecium]MQP28012.1 hypothetical protein [Sphingobacterium faecium]
MNFTFKLKYAFVITALACSTAQITSCKKDDKGIDKEEEAVLADSIKIIVPQGATAYYDLSKNTIGTESSNSFNLSGMYGSSLKAGNQGYQLGYFDLENTKIEDIKLASAEDFVKLNIKKVSSLGIDATSAGAPVTGPTWIIYDFKNNHAVYPTANRFVVLYKKADFPNNSFEVYIMRAKDVSALNGIGTYNLSIKKAIIDAPPLEDSKAVVKTSTVAVPSQKTIFFDLIKNQTSETMETSIINFSGTSGTTLKPSTADYKFGYFDLTGKTVEDIKVADLKGLDFKEATSLGLDATSMSVPVTGPTWMIYAGSPTHAVYPTANRFVLLYKGASLSENTDEVIIFKADELVTAGRDVTFKLKVKHFAK